MLIDLDPVRVRTNKAMKDADIVRAVRIVKANQNRLLRVWSDTHG